MASGLRGDLHAAAALHPLWPLALGAIVVAATALFTDGMRGSDHFDRLRRGVGSRAMPAALLLVVLAVLGW